MMKPLAHSAQRGYPAQTYQDHITNVCQSALGYAEEAGRFSADPGQLSLVVARAAEYHDLGKLDADNQKALRGELLAKRSLPVNHVDAGTAYLLQNSPDMCLSSVVVSAHHRGIPNLSGARFRDEHPDVRAKTDGDLPAFLRIHRQEVQLPSSDGRERSPGDGGLFLRMALSCLADADHGDTARCTGGDPGEGRLPQLKPAQRLEVLDRYVKSLEQPTERSHLRSTMYQDCRNMTHTGGFVSCDSPVGSGKTTAVMAHLLAQAAERGLRRIFVVLPYTNIIKQAVDVYRQALVLPGETPQEVVAELHHQADFDCEELRHLTALWRAPIIVTTAVGFFETLASNRPSALRRLHELPGSAVFVDEAHAALPVHLLPVAWHWMNALAREWSCYWLLASGSLVRFWELPELIQDKERSAGTVPELVSHKLHDQLMQYEADRVTFRWEPEPLSRTELIKKVVHAPGPRLLIVNTVQSAAVLAKDMAAAYGRTSVEHLSTALTPSDREKTIDWIKQRLQDPKDTDWVLVATSCVEAGVDLSFRSGFREAASLVSLLQTAGRINRSGSMGYAEVWTFQLQDEPKDGPNLKRNAGLDLSAAVLMDYLRKGMTPSPALSTCSIRDELHREAHTHMDLLEKEADLEFETVAEKFCVIDSQTVPVVVDKELAEDFRSRRCSWQDLQRNSISLGVNRIKEFYVPEIAPGLFLWERPYSPFLGYMEGVLQDKKSPDNHFIL